MKTDIERLWSSIDEEVIKETGIKYSRSRDVEDIVQAARLAAFVEFEKTKDRLPPETIAAYAKQSARYAAKDEYRRLKKQSSPVPPPRPANAGRDRTLSVRVTEDIITWLEIIASQESKTVSEVVYEKLEGLRLDYINIMREFARTQTND